MVDSDSQSKPRCPYNCPYKPSNDDRPEPSEPVDEEPIEKCKLETDMTTVIRQTDYQADVHAKECWSTDFGPKVGITSKPEYSDIWYSLDWERSHHKWESPRTEGTDMWEADLGALLYISLSFVVEGIDVTMSDEIRELFLREQEGLELDI